MPGQMRSGGTITLTAVAAMEPHRRVKIDSSGYAVYCSATEKAIGTTVDRAVTALDPVTVKLWNAPGTHLFSYTGAAATIGAAIYGAANGQVTDSSGGSAQLEGTALEAAAAASSWVEGTLNSP